MRHSTRPDRRAERRALRLAALAALAFAVPACWTPTVTVATQKPIEIRIDLHHEVRVQIDREVEELIEGEARAGEVTARGAGSADEQRVLRAKRDGVLGEQADGYLGTRAVAPALDQAALVERVNDRRQEIYRDLADERGLPLREVEKLAGAGRIQAAAPGEAIRTPEGEWLEKDEQTRVVVKDRTGGS